MNLEGVEPHARLPPPYSMQAPPWKNTFRECKLKHWWPALTRNEVITQVQR
jgi:hypothetical protein